MNIYCDQKNIVGLYSYTYISSNLWAYTAQKQQGRTGRTGCRLRYEGKLINRPVQYERFGGTAQTNTVRRRSGKSYTAISKLNSSSLDIPSTPSSQAPFAPLFRAGSRLNNDADLRNLP